MQYHQQTLRLTGFDIQEFDQVIENIHHIRMKVARQFNTRDAIEWDSSTFSRGYSTIDASNRLFSHITSTNKSVVSSVPFSDDVDPNGLLQRLVDQNGLFHLGENRVEYYELKKEQDTSRYTFFQWRESWINMSL